MLPALSFFGKIMYLCKRLINCSRRWQQSGKNIRQSYFTDLLQAVIDDKQEVKALPFKNNWIEFDTNEDYETAIKWIKSGEIRQIGNFLYKF